VSESTGDAGMMRSAYVRVIVIEFLVLAALWVVGMYFSVL
jgi:hypothetical protein